MTSTIKVDTIQDSGGNTIISSDGSGTITQTASIGSFSSTGIDDNASSTAITIDSSDNVGIGTSSPTNFGSNFKMLAVEGSDFGVIQSVSNSGSVTTEMMASATVGFIGTRTNHPFVLRTNDTERMRIDTSGNVGIGTSSPAERLDVQTTAGRFKVKALGGSSVQLESDSAVKLRAAANDVILDGASNIIFDIADAEKMRIDSSGNLLVGTTDTNGGISAGDTDGSAIALSGSTGQVFFTSAQATANAGSVGYFNRKTTDGEIVQFRKDGIVVGSIGTTSGYIYLANDDGDGVAVQNNAFRPSTDTGANQDNIMDCGTSSSRWDDIRATNGTIVTSDQNEKQSIQSLTATEIAVAKRISKLFKTFKWNSAVEEKGDNARTHTGIIAQDVQQAFADEGLDVGNYALFISDTWWEKEISVDAVAEELDEEGNVVVEGKDAYTYIDTKEEATEGYTERTRLGIRYPELLSFVSSAFEQRLTNIETRLETLENT